MISDTNARLVAARRLTRRQPRHEAGRFLAEGAQAVREALGRSKVVISIFATTEAIERNTELVEAARTLGTRVDEISVRASAALSETVRPQGIVAVCRKVHVPLRKAFDGEPRLVAVLVDANDPGNAGTILRTADAAGAKTVIFAGDSVDVYNGKVVRASAGSIFHIDVVSDVSADDAVTAARAAGCTVLAATGGGADNLDDLISGHALEKPTAWLFGNEANGLPREVIDSADRSVRVPVYGDAESLNVAAAAAVCLYSSARAHKLAHS
ncbi:MAG TPA: RNA methyltransferase [Jatrophihabitantaceae bacterium]|nr:RNA methyltransferase [Jatrophihabitantaceae bacterium]